ncbi:MAG: M48 family metalloprotease [Thermodesulfobacteriota bacterium]
MRIITIVTVVVLILESLMYGPPKADAGVFDAASFSPDEERALGKKFLLMVESRLPLISDPDVVSYVERVGRKILAQAGPQFFDYKFYVIRDEALNAFAAPSGLVFVHSGMLEAMDNESELAGILAHEVAHVVARHIARRIERMQKLSLITMAGVLAGVFLGGGGKAAEAVASGALATTSTLSLKYSREDEEEADRMAFKWVQGAGYDVRGMISTFKKIRRYRFLGSPTIPSYMTTHPALEERIGYLEDLILARPTPVVKEETAELRCCQVYLSLAMKSPAQLREKWEAELRKNPEDPYLYYGIALTYHAERQYGQANSYLDRAASLGVSRSLLQGERGINAFGEGRLSEALILLKQAVEDDPDVARFRLYLARTYKELGQVEEAVRSLERIKQDFPDYAEPYYHLGLIYGGRKETGLAQYNLGMYYKLTGEHRSAVTHLKQALQDKALSPGKRKEIQEILDDMKENLT